MSSLQKEAETDLLTRLDLTLNQLPGLTAQIKKEAQDACKASLSLSGQGAARNIGVLVRKEVYPRDARELLWRIRGESPTGLPLDWLIAAECLSEGAKALLEDERVGYFTAEGALFLSLPGLYLRTEPRTKKAAAPRTLRSLFTATRARVLQALLLYPADWFTVKELSAACAVAPATVSAVFSALERLEWAESRGKGPSKRRKLSSPQALLDEWVRVCAEKPPYPARGYFVPEQSSFKALQSRVLTLFNHQILDYAVTGAAAALGYAPSEPSPSVLEVYVASEESEETGVSVQSTLKTLGAQEVTEGANLKLIERVSAEHLLFARKIDRFNFANPVQVYLQLKRGGAGDCALAEHLRRETLRF